MVDNKIYSEFKVLLKLKHYLPRQSSLMEHTYQNNLDAFREDRFHEAMFKASEKFGYKTYLKAVEYQYYFKQGRINETILNNLLIEKNGIKYVTEWKNKLLNTIDEEISGRIGKLRDEFKVRYKIDPEKDIYPTLFKITSNYLDQGLMNSRIPVKGKSLIESVRDLEAVSLIGFFKTEKAKNLLKDGNLKIKNLLTDLVGDSALFEQYLFDQQMEHKGWSGFVATIEKKPNSFFQKCKISLEDFIILELLLEIDFLEAKHDESWPPLSYVLDERPKELFTDSFQNDYFEILEIWQEAFEWSHYNDVLNFLSKSTTKNSEPNQPIDFQAIFCMDDTNNSITKYLSTINTKFQFFISNGFFNTPFYFQSSKSDFKLKYSPAVIEPNHIIKEIKKSKQILDTDNKGFINHYISEIKTSIQLISSIFNSNRKKSLDKATNYMESNSLLFIENKNPKEVDKLKLGFTIEEMANNIELLLTTIGLNKSFAPIIYFIGHGGHKDMVKTHFNYECASCSGKASSVNARVVAQMANLSSVREVLIKKGINIPESTQFIGAIQDNFNDTIDFYDTNDLSEKNTIIHKFNIEAFNKAFELKIKHSGDVLNTSLKSNPKTGHAICYLGQITNEKHSFLKNNFAISYDYKSDLLGKHLNNLLRNVIPTCSLMNLDYYFSKMDPDKLGSGNDFSHTLMGLIGVTDKQFGDLKIGLSKQLVKDHEPMRLVVIIEHYPKIVEAVLNTNQSLLQWFNNEWIHLVVINPETKIVNRYKDKVFSEYTILH
jgi:hypothetical protein